MDLKCDSHSSEDRDACLASMFSSIVSALDVPSRELLCETVQHCHTRLHGPDCRDIPVMFFSERDTVRQAIARPHLSQISEPTNDSRTPMTPLNNCYGLQEDRLYQRLGEQGKQEYLKIRCHSSRAECLQLGHRYLLHLAHPHLPLEMTLRPTSITTNMEAEEERLSDDDYDDEVYSDEESWYTDISDVTRESDTPSSDPDSCEVEAG